MYKDLESDNIVLDIKGKGQILTPEFIVDYMVEQSILESRKTKPEGVLYILDPACGTGRFMLGVADYCNKNSVEYCMWNIDIDPMMYEATIRHAVHYKIPAVVILGNTLLNEFEKVVKVEEGQVEDLDVNKIIDIFKQLSENGKDAEVVSEKKKRVRKKKENKKDELS